MNEDEIIDEKTFDDLIAKAVLEKEIKIGADQFIDEPTLINHIKKNKIKIFDAASKEVNELNRLTMQKNNLEAQVKSEMAQFKPSIIFITKKINFSEFIGIMALFSTLWALISSSLINYTIYLDSYYKVIPILLIGYVCITAFEYKKAWDYVYSQDIDAIANDRKKELGVFELDEKIKNAVETVKNATLEKGILPELRSIINEKISPRYDTILNIITAKGLAEVFDPMYEVPTKAKEDLLLTLNNMPGGSIGIAGPRGAGKTTLIWSFCEGPIRSIKGKPLLAMMTSAPVEYDSRDFILHIFSLICTKIINISQYKRDMNLHLRSKDIHWVLLSILSLSVPIILGLAVSGIILYLLSILKTPMENEFSIDILLCSSYLIFFSLLINVILNSYEKSILIDHTDDNTDEHIRIVREPLVNLLELNIGNILIESIIMNTFLFGLLVVFRAIHLSNVLFFASLLINSSLLLYYTNSSISKHTSIEKAAIDGDKTDSLLHSASTWLKQIKFQQSYSEGWAGSLKLPIGLEGGINFMSSMAENQLNLPEIIGGYRDFLREVSKKYTVVLGIDELDKIQSDESAHRFLNQIKAIFGIDNVFYLISVSENAMSSFERRGLPIRDVFDSSFDKILYVDYLSLEDARQLMARRVIGLPYPFLCFCYSMSGGLARDLIRNCRDMYEFVQMNPNKNDLATVINSLIQEDLKSKLRALYVSAKGISHTNVVQFFLELYHIELSNGSVDAIEKNCADLLIKTANVRKSRDDDQISFLYEELSTYLYYSITLMEYFRKEWDKETINKADIRGTFSQLARARQFLEINPNITTSILNEFRKDNGLAGIS